MKPKPKRGQGGKPYELSQAAKRKLDSKKQMKEDFGEYQQPILSPLLRLEELRESYEFSLSPEHNDITIYCGERFRVIPDESEFIIRLLRQNQETGKVACIEIGMESFFLLKSRADVTCKLLGTCEKALIFQNGDVQLYVMEENQADGFLAHFENKEHVKISLNCKELKMWMDEYSEKIDRLYNVFLKRTIARWRRLEKKMITENKPKPEELLIGIMQPRKRACISYAE